MASYDEQYWQKLTVALKPVPLMGRLKRIVENQEQIVTATLVDDLQEHDLLESLLEESKPLILSELKRFDYLLRSPWRYPPLRWGSRFGRRHEPGIFYGALNEEALFAEAAYYRFLFLEGMQEPFGERVLSQHTVFEATYNTKLGADLSSPPYSRRSKVLMSKSNYSATQALGTVLREQRYEALLFQSARSKAWTYNIALFKPKALRSNKHLNPQRGLCETHADIVMFRFNRQIRTFSKDQFLVEGTLPVCGL